MPNNIIGQGSIFYNKARDNWTVLYYEKDLKTGKKKRKSKSQPTKEMAERFLTSMMYQRQNPLYIKKHKICLGDLILLRTNKKLETNIISEVSLGRIEKSVNIIKQSYLYKTKIDEITGDEIQNFLNSLTDYSNSVIKKVYSEFNQIFNYAFNKGYILSNPMTEVIRPKSKNTNKVIRALTLDEETEFSNYLKNLSLEQCKYKNVFLFQMFMGMRIGEVLALKTTDIDLTHNLISISRTLSKDKENKVIIGRTTKTYAGLRQIPIPKFLIPYVIEQMDFAIKNKNSEKLLFTNNKKEPVNSANVNYILRKILKDEFDIDDISTHSLRHTYGTRCIESGMRAVALQRLMGHTNISITLNVYTTVFNKFKESEIEKMNKYYMENNIIPEILPEHTAVTIEN